MQNRKLIFLCLVFSCFLFLAYGETGATKPKVALFISYPETFKGEEGRFQGTAIDILKAIETGLGRQLERQYTSWPRIMEYLGTERYDLTFLFNVPAFRDRVHFLGKIGCFADIIVPGQGLKVDDIGDLTGKTVAFMQKGAFARQYADTAMFHKVPTSQTENMIRLLVNERVDAIVIHSGQYHRLVNTEKARPYYPANWRDKLGEPYVLKLYEVQVTLSKKSKYQHLIPEIRQVITDQRQKGAFEKAQQNWGMAFWPCE